MFGLLLSALQPSPSKSARNPNTRPSTLNPYSPQVEILDSGHVCNKDTGCRWRLEVKGFSSTTSMLVVVKIRVPFWIPFIIGADSADDGRGPSEPSRGLGFPFPSSQKPIHRPEIRSSLL